MARPHTTGHRVMQPPPTPCLRGYRPGIASTPSRLLRLTSICHGICDENICFRETISYYRKTTDPLQGSSFRHEEFVCPLRSSYYTTDIRKSVFLKFTTGPNALVIYHSPQLVPQHPQPHLSSPLALVSSHRSLPALLKKPYSFRMDVGLARREMRIGQKESKIISIAPRAKFSQREAEGKSVVNLTVNDIAELFVMRQSDAAKYLGISLTSLKSSCRMLGLARWPYSRKRKQISELCLTSDGKRHGVNQHAILSETESSEEDTESDYTMNALANSSGETNVPAQNLNRSSASFNYLKDDQEALFLEALQHVVEK